MKNNFPNKATQSGNALFLILIAAALFAALSYVVTQSNRSGGGDPAREKYALDAAEIMGYITSLQTSIGRLVMNGCGLNVLSFDNESDGGLHENPDSPPDNKCHVFHPAGGGVALKTPASKWASDPAFYYTGSAAIDGIGTTCAGMACSDLVLVMRGVSVGLCRALNIASTYNSVLEDLPSITQKACPFTGTMDCSGDNTVEVIFSEPELKGKNAVCYNDSNHGLTFMHVILER